MLCGVLLHCVMVCDLFCVIVLGVRPTGQDLLVISLSVSKIHVGVVSVFTTRTTPVLISVPVPTLPLGLTANTRLDQVCVCVCVCDVKLACNGVVCRG